MYTHISMHICICVCTHINVHIYQTSRSTVADVPKRPVFISRAIQMKPLHMKGSIQTRPIYIKEPSVQERPV